MKELLVVRHAKSSWDNPGLRDFDRPLNGRGNRDAPFMAKHARDTFGIPDLLVTSPAARAKTTARHFLAALGGDIDLWEDENLYGADEDEIFSVVYSLPDEAAKVFLFAHNPGISHFVGLATGEYPGPMPTCGLALLQSPGESWTDFIPGSATLAAFEYPRMFRGR